MPLQPVYANGRVRLIAMNAGDEAREEWLKEQENERRAGIWKRRMYYAGEQYEAENQETAEALGIDWLTGRLPEHHRKHAYSTQIAESVDFLADQMTKKFEVEADSPDVQAVVDATLAQMENPEALLREALIAGDLAVRVEWDEVEDGPRLMFYESEQVRFDFAQDDRTVLEKVSMEEVVWVDDAAGEMQKVRTTEWLVVDGQAVKRMWMDDDPVEETPLELPFLPWALLRGMVKSMSATRGESVMTQQAMECADRYNAVEQVAWLIARYNSHGNLAVIGDAASLKAQQEERIEKDVADVLTFPGGTAITSITLPTDTQMIEHQRKTLLDALYAVFGLTRLDPETVTGLGSLSGYALEILNRKTDGTFDRIRKQWSSDLMDLVGLVLDVVSERKGTVFQNRAMEVRLGGVYIVDDAQIRDDFAAGLISREEALRKRGYTDEEIGEITSEAAAGEAMSFSSQMSGGFAGAL
jgi:hypothetical protein